MENVFSDELMTEFGGAGEGFVYSVRAENAGQQIGSLREINIKQKQEWYEKQKGFFFPSPIFAVRFFVFVVGPSCAQPERVWQPQIPWRPPPFSLTRSNTRYARRLTRISVYVDNEVSPLFVFPQQGSRNVCQRRIYGGGGEETRLTSPK